MTLVAALHAQRAREHRFDPPAPLQSAEDAVRFVVETGVVMASGRSSLPALTEAIVGHTIKGSWMAGPEGQWIYDVWTEVDKVHRVASVPLVQAKQVYVRAEHSPAVASIAADPHRLAQAVAGLKPTERQLYDDVVASGEVRADEWSQVNALTTSQTRTARVRLAALFLVEAQELHTDAGYHTVLLRPARHGKPKLGFANATRGLLHAAIRACVVADAKEVRKWNDWSAAALDALLDDGVVVPVDPAEKFVACAELV